MKYLVVVDMQNDFIDGSLGSSEAVKILPAVIEKIAFYKDCGTIICTLDTHDENYMDILEAVHLPVAHCVKGTQGWELNDGVKKALEDTNFISFEKNVFGSTCLADYLKEHTHKGDTIEIIGLCTDICVVSNALLIKAACKEAEVICDSLCCAGTSVENHNAALMVMKSCQCIIK